MTDAIGWHSQIAEDFDAKYATSPAFRERFDLWSRLIGRYAAGDVEVLDAGCGSGVFSELAARQSRSVLGFDGSPEMVALARARAERHGLGNAEFQVAAMGEGEMISQRGFGLILCSSVLEYVEDYWRAFDWLAAALAPGGTIVFSMPNGASLYRKAERLLFRATGRPAYYAHVRHVPTPAEVRAGLAQRGFSARSVDFYAAAPIVSPLARRLGRADLADNLFVIACGRSP